MTMLAEAPAEAIGYGAEWHRLVNEIGREIFRPMTRVSLAEWAERNRRWPDGTRYQIDRTPHVREVLEAYSDPSIEEITVVKPSQSGLTEGGIVNLIGYRIDQDPRPVLLVVPSVEEAKKWSHKKLQPMLDSTPVVRGKLDSGSRKTSDTVVEKGFPGGSLGIIGSNSGRGFRMVTIGDAIADDVEGWDATAGKGAGSDGDQVVLLRRRTDRIADRKHLWVSTPKNEGGKIHRLMEEMDRVGVWQVPCPECGEYQHLKFGGEDEPFGLKWEKEEWHEGRDLGPDEVLRGTTVHKTDTAYYVCEANGCYIPESAKRQMELQGQYLTEDGEPVRVPGVRNVGLWARGVLSMTLPGAEWPRIIKQFLKIPRGDTHALKSFWNLVLAEFWEVGGDAPDWRRIYDRREELEQGVVQEGAVMLTASVDVQGDRLEADVWAWGADKQSWPVDLRIYEGNPWRQETWDGLTELLHESYPSDDGRQHFQLAAMAVDTGFAQEAAMEWARRVADRRVMLIKGEDGRKTVLGTPTKTEVTIAGRRVGRLLWPVGVSVLKHETYGYLNLETPLDDEPYPPGWIHIPTWWDDEACKQLTAESLRVTPQGQEVWEKNRHRNERLDNRNYARAAAEREGLSRGPAAAPPAGEGKKKHSDSGDTPDRKGGWLDRGGSRRRGRGSWL